MIQSLQSADAPPGRRPGPSLQEILDSLPVRVFWKDAECRYLGCNLPFARDAGLDSPGQILGLSDSELAWAAQAPFHRADDLRVMTSGVPKAAVEESQLTPSGERIWLRTSKMPLRDALGQVRGVLGTYENVTDRMRAEEELRRQNTFRKAIIENAAEGICVCHEIPLAPFSHCTVWNAGMAAITGYLPDEVNRLGWHRALWPDPALRRTAEARMPPVLQGGHLNREEWQITGKDGRLKTVAISTAAIGEEGGATHVMALVHDLTDLKRAEVERLKIEARVLHAQKLESLGVLAGGIAHDFNNLLVAMLGHAELGLVDAPGRSPVRAHFEQIRAAAQRAADLCRQMLAYSGRGQVTLESLDLRDLARETLRMLQVSISKSAELNLDFPDDLPTVRADPTQLRQVLMNLVTNASEALDGRAGRVTIRTGAQEVPPATVAGPAPGEQLPAGRYVALEVSDTGCGMDETTRARMFEPFFSTKFTGRGLGMAAVLGIVRGHKGAIEVRSRPAVGTTVRILLPAEPEKCAQAPARAPAPENWRPSGKVLFVDDDPVVRSIGGRMLERLGLDVVPAANGFEAVRLFQAHAAEIRCVILDLTMPQRDGHETFRELRRIDPRARVILSSGYTEEDAAQRFNGSGISAFLQKPYQLAALQATLRRVLP